MKPINIKYALVTLSVFLLAYIQIAVAFTDKPVGEVKGQNVEGSGELTTSPATTTAAETEDNTKEDPEKSTQETTTEPEPESDVWSVPFYSQFGDISRTEWQGQSCGIAALAMLIDHYQEPVLPDTLLERGIESGAYIYDAGWSHQGLINLAIEQGLTGYTNVMHHLPVDKAFAELEEEVKEGPVMVSVHYTFVPTNPIPHLVVVTGVRDGEVYYNDPADEDGNHSVSIEQFKSAWKKRYIAIRPEAV